MLGENRDIRRAGVLRDAPQVCFVTRQDLFVSGIAYGDRPFRGRENIRRQRCGLETRRCVTYEKFRAAWTQNVQRNRGERRFGDSITQVTRLRGRTKACDESARGNRQWKGFEVQTGDDA